MEADEGEGRASYLPKYDGEGLIRPFSLLCRGLPPRKERGKGTTEKVDPLRVAPQLDKPDENKDSVLAWQDNNNLEALKKSS